MKNKNKKQKQNFYFGLGLKIMDIKRYRFLYNLSFSNLLMSSSFDIVVVTAPTQAQCQIYFTLCSHIKSSVAQFNRTSFFCVPDPLNARVGSGGGTLNTIDYLTREQSQSLASAKTLVVHSGGDSRRSPLHSVCGKAWATLNCSVDESLAASPILLLLVEFDLFFARLAPGSLVVASSDVLLDIHKVSSSSVYFLQLWLHMYITLHNHLFTYTLLSRLDMK